MSAEDRLKVGGPAVLKKYLTTVRPFLVRALMAHLDWLASQGRLEPEQELTSAAAEEAAATLEVAEQTMRNTLKALLSNAEIEAAGVDGSKRPEQLDLADNV